MTFIVAIQLNNSIIITADNKKAVLKETGKSQFDTKKFQKFTHGIKVLSQIQMKAM